MKRILLLLSVFTAGTLAAAQAQTNADNTGQNARDRDEETVTPADQSNDPADLKMAAAVRKMVVEDETISALGKNAKIIVIDGVVTLRGPVETAEDKAAIEAHAKHVNPKSIVNELEIKTP